MKFTDRYKNTTKLLKLDLDTDEAKKLIEKEKKLISNRKENIPIMNKKQALEQFYGRLLKEILIGGTIALTVIFSLQYFFGG